MVKYLAWEARQGHFPYFISFAFISFSVVTIDQTNDFPLQFLNLNGLKTYTLFDNRKIIIIMKKG